MHGATVKILLNTVYKTCSGTIIETPFRLVGGVEVQLL
jgi:hypothetical protein